MNELYTITNCIILTIDNKDTCYPHGSMVIKDGKIIALGEEKDIQPQGEVINLQGKLVMPGMINTHTHSHSSLFRSLGDDMELMDWLHHAMWPTEKLINSEIAKAAAKMSCLEYIKGGITTYADQFYFANDVADAASHSGLRCFLAASVFTNPTAETEDTFGAAQDFIENWIGREAETRVFPCIGPHAPYSVDPHLFKKVISISEKYDLLIHIHISETKDENRQIMEQYGMTPTEWLNSMGLFKQKVLAAHNIWLSDHDMEIYSENQVHASYNPVSNLKLVSGIMPYKEMRDAGIQISIGTDGSNSNNSMDLLRDLKTGILIQKMRYEDATLLPAREAIRMLTIEGAKALSLEEETGTLEVGKRADFICLDTRSPRLTPLYAKDTEKVYASVVYSAYGADVSDMAVDGEWIMRDYRVLSMNEEQIRENAQQAGEYLLNACQ